MPTRAPATVRSPEAHRLVADPDAPLVQEVLDVAKREREADVEHHREVDDLRGRSEIAEGRARDHSAGVR
jgi:hypothetical protein